MQEFLQKYCHQTVPARQTLTRHMEKEAGSILQTIKEKLTDKDFYVAVDETTDRCGRAMTAILCGPLDGSAMERPFLVDVLDIEAANNETVQQAITGALHRLFGSDLNYRRVRLFLTDGAAYCLKAGRGLKDVFPNLLHVTCICHGLNRVAETVRYEYELVDQLISEMKKIFVKVPRRRQALAATRQAPPVPLPVITH